MSRSLIIAALTVSCALPVLAMASAQSDYKEAHEAAVSASHKAASMNTQWTTTVKVLSKAEETASSGDYEKADQLAQRAEKLAKLSIKQAEEQKSAWQQIVPK